MMDLPALPALPAYPITFKKYAVFSLTTIKLLIVSSTNTLIIGGAIIPNPSSASTH
jgi:carbohydrate-binding DOMON domain-containing protein